MPSLLISANFLSSEITLSGIKKVTRFHLFLYMCLLIYSKGRVRERSSMCWFNLQMFTTATVWAGPKSGAWNFIWMATWWRDPNTWATLTVFQGTGRLSQEQSGDGNKPSDMWGGCFKWCLPCSDSVCPTIYFYRVKRRKIISSPKYLPFLLSLIVHVSSVLLGFSSCLMIILKAFI